MRTAAPVERRISSSLGRSLRSSHAFSRLFRSRFWLSRTVKLCCSVPPYHRPSESGWKATTAGTCTASQPLPISRPRQSRPVPHDPRRLARPASALFSCELSSLCSIDCPRARRGQGTPGARFMVRALAESRGHVAAAPPHQLPRSRPTEVEIDTVSALLEPNVRVQPACAGPARWRRARPAPFDFCMSRAGARVHSEAE